MRHLIFISVAVLTFGLGVLVDSVGKISGTEVFEIQPVSNLMEDDWHRIFEAATMLKDTDERIDVLGRLQCLGSEHSLRKHRFTNEDGIFCVEFDGVIIKTLFTAGVDDPYDRITRTHREWSSKNMDFVRSVANPVAAESYLRRRLRDE